MYVYLEIIATFYKKKCTMRHYNGTQSSFGNSEQFRELREISVK